jgi:hypothetical protein
MATLTPFLGLFGFWGREEGGGDTELEMLLDRLGCNSSIYRHRYSLKTEDRQISQKTTPPQKKGKTTQKPSVETDRG